MQVVPRLSTTDEFFILGTCSIWVTGSHVRPTEVMILYVARSQGCPDRSWRSASTCPLTRSYYFVQVLAAFAQVAQQRSGAGGVHDALLLRLSNQQHHEPDRQGDGAHPAKPQRNPVRCAGCHQVSRHRLCETNFMKLTWLCKMKEVLRAYLACC